MQIQRLALRNFRGFDELDLEFSPSSRTTILIGINGSGKTSVLDALVMLCSQILEKRQRLPSIQLTPRDLKIGKKTCRIEIQVVHEDTIYTWKQEIGEIDISFPDAPPIAQANDDLDILRPTPFPILAFYPVERVVRDFRDDDTKAPILHNGPVYERFRSDGSADFSSFLQWFLARENIENEEIRINPDFRDPQLETVRNAITKILPKFKGPRVRRARGRREVVSNTFIEEGTTLLVEKGTEHLALGQLSHGERTFFALAGDIARRMAMAFPNLADPCQGPGIIIIDEICLHLHPQWQGEIIPKLEAAFPTAQFIVTTHSPQVVSRMPPEGVEILEDFSLVTGTRHTYGRDTNSILSDVMGLDPRPPFAKKWLRTIALLIDDGDWASANEALSKLEVVYGQSDAEVIRLRTIIDVLAGPGGDDE
jgi:predicted ATP-binding protein involved in virulence